MRACVRASVRACVRVLLVRMCVLMCVHVCAFVCVYVHNEGFCTLSSVIRLTDYYSELFFNHIHTYTGLPTWEIIINSFLYKKA